MVVHYPRERPRDNSERPAAIRDVLRNWRVVPYLSSAVPPSVATRSG